MAWLVPPSQHGQHKTSKLEGEKRRQLFAEFIYYIFDSLVIPLIRSNFHVTESSVHRNRLFFFRHDVWRALSEPILTSLRRSIFQEVPAPYARDILDHRPLGYSQIRLLPKENGARPIMNLRRRSIQAKPRTTVLGRSINSIMKPVHDMLKYEKTLQSDRLGGALFSVGEMYPRLKSFKENLFRNGRPPSHLYFVKVDVRSCFDTIPQTKVVELIETLASQDSYRIGRHTEIRPAEGHGHHRHRDHHTSAHAVSSRPGHGKARRRFHTHAHGSSDFVTFSSTVNDVYALDKRHSIFVDQVVRRTHTRDDLLNLLDEHVRHNLVKIGKKIYRQKAGIPQGSVVSSLLCNFFYADFERSRLGFLSSDDGSLLLRLIDDFLLITTKREHAMRFLTVMCDGDEDYGISVNPKKSMVNFDVVVDGIVIPRSMNGIKGRRGSLFPYCGCLIDTRTLEVSKDRTIKVENLSMSISPTDTFWVVLKTNLDNNFFNSDGRFIDGGVFESTRSDLSSKMSHVSFSIYIFLIAHPPSPLFGSNVVRQEQKGKELIFVMMFNSFV